MWCWSYHPLNVLTTYPVCDPKLSISIDEPHCVSSLRLWYINYNNYREISMWWSLPSHIPIHWRTHQVASLAVLQRLTWPAPFSQQPSDFSAPLLSCKLFLLPCPSVMLSLCDFVLSSRGLCITTRPHWATRKVFVDSLDLDVCRICSGYSLECRQGNWDLEVVTRERMLVCTCLCVHERERANMTEPLLCGNILSPNLCTIRIHLKQFYMYMYLILTQHCWSWEVVERRERSSCLCLSWLETWHQCSRRPEVVMQCDGISAFYIYTCTYSLSKWKHVECRA